MRKRLALALLGVTAVACACLTVTQVAPGQFALASRFGGPTLVATPHTLCLESGSEAYLLRVDSPSAMHCGPGQGYQAQLLHNCAVLWTRRW